MDGGGTNVSVCVSCVFIRLSLIKITSDLVFLLFRTQKKKDAPGSERLPPRRGRRPPWPSSSLRSLRLPPTLTRPKRQEVVREKRRGLAGPAGGLKADGVSLGSVTTENCGASESSCPSPERRSFFCRGSESSPAHKHVHLHHLARFRRPSTEGGATPGRLPPLGEQCRMMLPSWSWVSVTDLMVSTGPSPSPPAAAELILLLLGEQTPSPHEIQHTSV